MDDMHIRDALQAFKRSAEVGVEEIERNRCRVENGWLVLQKSGKPHTASDGVEYAPLDPIVYFDEFFARVVAKSIEGSVVTVREYLEG